MQVAMKKSVAGARPSARSSVKVVCQAGATERVQIAAASAIAAALLVSSAPAYAGVVMVQPERKKLFQADGSVTAVSTSSTSSPAAKAAPKAKAAAAPSVKAEPKEEFSFGGDIDPRAVALPGSILVVGAGLAAAYKLDPEWSAFFSNAMVRDSNAFAGYEPELKPEGGYVGTRKVKATGTKKGIFGGFGKK